MFQLLHHHGRSFGPQSSVHTSEQKLNTRVLSDIDTFTNNGYRSDVIDMGAIFVTLPNSLEPKMSPWNKKRGNSGYISILTIYISTENR